MTVKAMDQTLHDIYVVSDLHMGRGRNPDTQRFYALENFFYDDDFVSFCEHLCREAAERHRSFRLVLNGDIFDLLRIDHDPPSSQTTPVERRFGPVHTPSQAAKTIGLILQGHPGFRRGLAQILYAGYQVIFLPGNHDLEIQWAQVQQVIMQALEEEIVSRYGEDAKAQVGLYLRFSPWFYHEPGRIWIEHGCQYDPENSFRYLLRQDLAEQEVHIHEMEQDMPLGNFFQRYLYNFFGHITFIVPSTRANLRYFRWLLFHEPRLLFRVIVSHGPFFFQVLRRMSKPGASIRRLLADVHHQRLQHLAQSSQLGEKLLAIDALKEVRADAVNAMRTFGWQTVKFLGGAFAATILLVSMWFLGFQAINSIQVGYLAKTLSFLFLDFLMAMMLVGGLLYTGFHKVADVSPRPLRRAAQRIAQILDIPIITFGHSHDEELWWVERSAQQKSWYYNTGTWVAVFTHDVLIPRERIQYTYLQVRDQNAELRFWSPSRSKNLPVILQDEGNFMP